MPRFGDAVIDHYVHTANWEQFEYDRRITDWELMRGFEDMRVLMTDIVCISPVDGREVARKATASASEIESAVAAARKAQAQWARVPVAERARLCSAAVDAMLAMRAEIAPELSWQMGRPIKYAGGELARLRGARALHDRHRGEALSPLVPAAKDGFKRYVRRDPLGIVLTVAPWNYPYLTAVNSVIPGTDGGQRRHSQSRRADHSCRRTFPERDGQGRPAEGAVPNARAVA